jgi:hypothetical protein
MGYVNFCYYIILSIKSYVACGAVAITPFLPTKTLVIMLLLF